MNASREAILSRLRSAVQAAPFADVPASDAETRLAVTRIESHADMAAMRQRFIAEVERVRGVVHSAAGDDEARRILINLLQQKQAKRATVWHDAALPFGIDALLQQLEIAVLRGQMRELVDADVGITGAACAIAATGTLVLEMGAGKSRAASLLPPLHIALLRTKQLLPRLEDYVAQQRAQGLPAFEQGSNVVLLTGASRTADIEMNVVYGVHGPLELHIVLIEGD
jgi:L-lactate dehydrogenase complex protein LldG